MRPLQHATAQASRLTVGKRVAIVGTSGSGKTTLAGKIAGRCGHFHLELDAIHHLPNWEPIERGLFLRQVKEELEPRERWVTCGNYSKVGAWIRSQADTVIWLDLPRWLVVRRIFRRTLMRGLTRRELWNGNRERLTGLIHPNPERNMVLWAWTTHRRRHLQFEQEWGSGAWNHAGVLHFTRAAEVDEFVRGLGSMRVDPGDRA